MLHLVLAAGLLAAPPPPVAWFTDPEPGALTWDSTWATCAVPSSLTLGEGHHLPVTHDVSFLGTGALRLAWCSARGGSWSLAVARQGWRPADLTKHDRLRLWLNAPSAVPAADLPEVSLEDLDNHQGTFVPLCDGVDADPATWQRIDLPLAALRDEVDLSRIKTVFLRQRGASGRPRVLWLDELRFLSGSDPLLGAPEKLATLGQDRRVDLQWQPVAGAVGYQVYRAGADGDFERVTSRPHPRTLYADFVAENGLKLRYRITAVGPGLAESPASDAAGASTAAMDDEALLTSVQRATFRYFYDYGHPVSGLARERLGSGNVCTIGGSGFGLMTLVVGAERGFEPRAAIAARVLTMLQFLETTAQRFHGAWSHWLDGATGRTIPFGPDDDGGDLVETAFLCEGLLTIRQYFTGDDPIETAIRRLATELWEGVEWDWYRGDPPRQVLLWHWSPNHGFQKNHEIRGFDETLLTYLLAIASPTHPVPPELYRQGYAGRPSYRNGSEHFGLRQWVGPNGGGPLFFTHYSFLGFDPRAWRDESCSYFEHSRSVALLQRAYAIANPGQHLGYGENVWGLTACDGPDGYLARAPFGPDDGTIAPTAALSSMPYTPAESIAALRYDYEVLGPRLWGEFGFHDSFCLERDWFASSYLAIDQGPIVPMIENYRTGLCWRLFMANGELAPALAAAGWHRQEPR